MATLASLNFPLFTNTRIAWADVAALNNFFGSITVNISAANLPEATLTEIGALKQIQIVEPVAPAVVVATLNIVADDGATQNEVAMASYVASLAAQVDYLKQYIEALYSQLNSQGYVGS